MELLLTDKSKTVGRACFRGEDQEFSLIYIEFEMFKYGECESFSIVPNIIISVS